MTRWAERDQLVLSLREREQLTYADIGRLLFISGGRAKQIYLRAVMWRKKRLTRSGTIIDLPTRAYNCLLNAGLPRNATASDVAAVLPLLKRGTKCRRMGGISNFGKKSLADVEYWLDELRTLSPEVSGFGFNGLGIA